MASPSAMSASEDTTATTDVAFHFCKNCSNLLHPIEDKQRQTLRYRCRTCYYAEDAKALCIHRRTYAQNAGATAGVTQDVSEDPAVSGTSGHQVPSRAPSLSPDSESDSEDSGLCNMCGETLVCDECHMMSSELMPAVVFVEHKLPIITGKKLRLPYENESEEEMEVERIQSPKKYWGFGRPRTMILDENYDEE